MPGRIITLQRQARELGRLRTGTYNGQRPVRSDTWIVSSHAEHYVQAAAEVWGGTVEKWQPQGNGAQQWRVITEAVALDAILPPGDPLSQSYETWSRGGVQRRCDGMTEALTDEPCLCRAKWGDNFHESAPRDAACKATTRLNVILPEMPDIGAWRVETHSYHSANEMAAAVDVLKGSIGDSALIPIRLRIEQRTRVVEGKTKHFPVVAVELRGATAGQVLAGVVAPVAVNGGQRPALAAGTRPAPLRTDYVAAIRQAPTREKVEELWRQAREDGAPAEPVVAAAQARVAELQQAQAVDPTKAETWIKAALACRTMADLTAALAQAQAAGFATDLADPADVVAAAFAGRRASLEGPAGPDPGAHLAEDATALWQQIVAEAGARGFDKTADVEQAFAARWQGDTPAQGSPSQMKTFLGELRSGRVKPPGAAPAKPAEPVPAAAAPSGAALDSPPF